MITVLRHGELIMSISFQIFLRDLKRIVRKPFVLIIVLGMCLIPSLYAWFNIYANMDPYALTGNIQIAVTNTDSGETVENVGDINIGNDIVDELGSNHKLGWTFVDEDTALSGVRSGDFYAAIIIPGNFTQDMLSFLSGTLTKPSLDYYVNEKVNAIAPKVTDSGANTVESSINKEFVAAVSKILSELASEKFGDLESGLDSGYASMISSLRQIRSNIHDYQEALDSFETLCTQSDASLDEMDTILQSLSDAALTSSDALTKGRSTLTDAQNASEKYVSSVSGIFDDSVSSLSGIRADAAKGLGDLNAGVHIAYSDVSAAFSIADRLDETNGEIVNGMNDLLNEYGSYLNIDLDGDGVTPYDNLSAIVSTINNNYTRHSTLLHSVENMNQSLASLSQTAFDSVLGANYSLDDYLDTLQSLRSNFSDSTVSRLNQSLNGISSSIGTLSALLTSASSDAQTLRLSTQQLRSCLTDIRTTLTSTGSALSSVSDDLESLIGDLSALSSSQFYQTLEGLSSLDSDAISNALSSPVELETNSVYPVENYGSGMTPFYTSLAIWVGGLVMIALFKLTVDEDEEIHDFRPYQAYFGRWYLFILIGLIQTVICCLGNIFLLHVQCLHPVLFTLASCVASFVYVNLIYALTAAFRNVGKAISVILIILQIPGSAGTYPIEMTPAFYRAIHPWLPFTYAINALRECVAGLYDHALLIDLFKLSLFLIFAVIIGLLLRPVCLGLTSFFDSRLVGISMFNHENADTVVRQFRGGASRVLLAADEQRRRNILKRAEKFDRIYPKLHRAGYILFLIVPSLFLLMMFGVNIKMVSLILWILSIIAVVVFLTVVEYMHYHLAALKFFAGMTDVELLRYVREEEDKEKKKKRTGKAVDDEKPEASKNEKGKGDDPSAHEREPKATRAENTAGSNVMTGADMKSDRNTMTVTVTKPAGSNVTNADSEGTGKEEDDA